MEARPLQTIERVIAIAAWGGDRPFSCPYNDIPNGNGMASDAHIHLATYGTLGPGRPNHHQVEMLRGEWTTGFVRGQLRNDGWAAEQGFPGLVLGERDKIAVDLLRSEDLPGHWARLDAFEGDGYRRVVARVATANGSVDACIYVLAAN